MTNCLQHGWLKWVDIVYVCVCVVGGTVCVRCGDGAIWVYLCVCELWVDLSM